MTRGLAGSTTTAIVTIAAAAGTAAATGAVTRTEWSLRRCPWRPLRRKSGAHLIAIVGLTRH